MRVKTAVSWLAPLYLVVALCGCQAGKSPMGRLAWWKKDDALASKYVEPPSQNFTPSESALANDDSELPPLPPDIDKTVDSFGEEIARSYRELARDTEQARGEFSSSAAGVAAKTSSDGREKEKPTTSATEFSNPLIPRADDQLASQMRSPSANSGLEPLKPSPTDSKDNEFKASPGMTQYEKLAQRTLSFDADQMDAPRPEAKLPDTLSPLKPASSGGFQPSSGPVAQNPNPAGPFAPAAKSATAPTAADPSPSEGQHVNYEYPSTPYHAFQPRNGDGTSPTNSQLTEQVLDTATESVNHVAGGTKHTFAPAGFRAGGVVEPPSPPASNSGNSTGGMPTLNLQGQGSYAPGSVQAPSSLNQGQFGLPKPGGSNHP